MLAAAGIGVGAFFGIRALTGDEDEAPAPSVAVERNDESRAPRSSGSGCDQEHDPGRRQRRGRERGRRRARHVPVHRGVEGPAAVTLVPSSDWAAAIAASVLVADPVGAPILISDGDEVPDQARDGDRGASARGSCRHVGRGGVPDRRRRGARGNAHDRGACYEPGGGGRRHRPSPGEAHRQPAAEHRRRVQRGPRFAMPAAAWPRAGDPVLFVERDRVQEATLDALKRHRGPRSSSSARVGRVRQGRPRAREGGARRRADIRRDPVANAIAFARFDAGTFGWNVADPGHGLVIANATRPLDAAAAAPLSAAGSGGRCWSATTQTRCPRRCAATCSTSSRDTVATPRARSTTMHG